MPRSLKFKGGTSMNTWKRRTVRAAQAVLILTVVSLAPRGAAAQATDVAPASMGGVTFGGRAMYFRAKNQNSGDLSGGAQLRLHLTSVLAVEGSADYRQNKYGGTVVDVYPVQASLLLYILPSLPVSPYILGGVGWYNTHVQGQSGHTDRYGPHAGAGIEAALGRHWTVDADARYLWTQSLTAPTTAHPAGDNFSDNGFMITTALNYRF
jgi:opacity protein-like surface antigen